VLSSNPLGTYRKGKKMAQKKSKANAEKVSALQKKVVAKSQRNSKAKVKKFYTDKGTTILLEAITISMSLPVMPSTIDNAEAMRQWCITNNAPSVQRNIVCRKATNYRADNAIRQRLQSLQNNNIITASVDVVWATNNAIAKREPFSVQAEKVFIVRK
jgi:hypothetical protein